MLNLERTDIERAVLAIILIYPDRIPELDNKLHPNDFHNSINKLIFREVIQLFNSGFENFTEDELTSVLLKTGSTDQHLLEEYVSVLYNMDINPSNLSKYIDIILDIRLKRELHSLLNNKIIKLEEESETSKATELVSSLQNDIIKLNSSSSSNDSSNISEIIDHYIHKKLSNKEANYGVPSHIPELDRYTLGWKKKRLYVVSARPSEGKSALLMNFALHAAFFAKFNRCPVLCIDTEMDTEEWIDRAISYLSGVDYQTIQVGNWTRSTKEEEAVDKAVLTLQESNNLFFEAAPDFGIDNLTSMIRHYVYKYNVGLVIFDYIKLPEASDLKTMQQWQHVYALAKRLKFLAKTLDIPIISALQQNKEGDEKSHVSGAAFGESDGVLKECDGMFPLNRKTAREVERDGLDYGTHILQIYKLRNGPRNYKGLGLDFKGYNFRFTAAKKQMIDLQQLKVDEPVPEKEIRLLNNAKQTTNAIL